MTISGIAIFVACVIILIYGYVKNNRNLMLAAAIALFLSTGLREFLSDAREAQRNAQAGFRDGYEAAQKAKSQASAPQK
jgi:hypothetical protein